MNYVLVKLLRVLPVMVLVIETAAISWFSLSILSVTRPQEVMILSEMVMTVKAWRCGPVVLRVGYFEIGTQLDTEPGILTLKQLAQSFFTLRYMCYTSKYQLWKCIISYCQILIIYILFFFVFFNIYGKNTMTSPFFPNPNFNLWQTQTWGNSF